MIGGTSGSWHRKLIQTSGTLALALFEESDTVKRSLRVPVL